MAFDFGNANEAQRSAISTTDGPLLIIAKPWYRENIYISKENCLSYN